MAYGVERRKENLIGKEFETRNFGKCVVVDYQGNTKVYVEFYEPKCITVCKLEHLKIGKVKNPMFPFVLGVGYIGVGEHTSVHTSVTNKKYYSLWKGILSRCYDESQVSKFPSYRGVKVCEEWHNFQNFAEWCKHQEFLNSKDTNGRYFQLDKDILIKGNKVYSPETCCFVPNEINSLILGSKNARGEYPLGVYYYRRNGKFRSALLRNGKHESLGYFDTPKDAFLAYKKAKESHIKDVANKWMGKISDRAYQALMKWEISEND